MKKFVSYHDFKIKSLKDKEYACIYLEAALEAYREDGDREAFLIALRDIFEAQGNVPGFDFHESIDKDLERIHLEIIRKRRNEIKTGQIKPFPGEEALAQARRQLKK